jgi:hypothetical protein
VPTLPLHVLLAEERQRVLQVLHGEGLPHKHEQRFDEEEMKALHWFTRAGLINGRHSKLHTTLPLGKFVSRMNAETDSILLLCAFLLRSVFAITSDIVPMIPENTNPPTIMPKHAMTRSHRVVALMSPYPTVV